MITLKEGQVCSDLSRGLLQLDALLLQGRERGAARGGTPAHTKQTQPQHTHARFHILGHLTHLIPATYPNIQNECLTMTCDPDTTTTMRVSKMS